MRTPPPNRPPDNIWFRLLIPAGFLFCATSLSWVMTTFDRSGAPIVRWINQYAVWAILVESVAIVLFAVVAMSVDRRESVRRGERSGMKNALPERGPGKAEMSNLTS